jgi:hypothetical protein
VSAPEQGVFDDIVEEVREERNDLVGQFAAHPGGRSILRLVVDGVFPGGMEDAVATHPTHTTEREVIIGLIAVLTMAVEQGVVE